MRGFIKLFKRFHSDERGVFAVLFALMALVLITFAGAVVDYTQIEQARTRAQQALDSAALGLLPTIYDDPTEDELMASAEALVEERLAMSDTEVAITAATPDTDSGTLLLAGSVTVPMAFMHLIGIPTVSAAISAEATRGSVDLEVAVALDNTGSMKYDIDDLQDALDELIDLVVQEEQEPTYSKMAIIPWSEAVNVGDLADEIRGSVPAGKTLTNIRWMASQVDVSGITKANPAVVTTSSSHGFATGDVIYLANISGMWQVNNKYFKVVYKTSTTFSLQTTAGVNVNSSSYNSYSTSSSDKARKCLITSCEVVVTATGHGFATGDHVHIVGTSNSSYNGETYTVTSRTADTFSLDGVTSTSSTDPRATGGKAYCTEYLCEYYYFEDDDGDWRTYQITDCVTERATNTYTEDPPTTTLLGANYESNGVCDIDQDITPLTSDTDVLYDESDEMDDHGSTAGHLGTAWAWYMLSPEFGYLWPDAENVPADYDEPNLLKVAIIMTDGVYNRQYCNGVRTGIIDCDAPDDTAVQAAALCEAMKDEDIVVYTIGYNIDEDSDEEVLLTDCASDDSKAFFPDSGGSLIDTFQEIGQNITDLRLSK